MKENMHLYKNVNKRYKHQSWNKLLADFTALVFLLFFFFYNINLYLIVAVFIFIYCYLTKLGNKYFK